MNQRNLIVVSFTAVFVLSGCCATKPEAPREISFAPAEAGSVKVMSFNIRANNIMDFGTWSSRKTLVFDVIADHAPDVLGLQEPLQGQLRAGSAGLSAVCLLFRRRQRWQDQRPNLSDLFPQGPLRPDRFRHLLVFGPSRHAGLARLGRTGPAFLQLGPAGRKGTELQVSTYIIRIWPVFHRTPATKAFASWQSRLPHERPPTPISSWAILI